VFCASLRVLQLLLPPLPASQRLSLSLSLALLDRCSLLVLIVLLPARLLLCCIAVTVRFIQGNFVEKVRALALLAAASAE